DDSTFDLITTSMAIHWFDHKQFLTEAHRVLKTRGWLIPYTNGFYGQMKENQAFEGWSKEIYPNRYPAPPRNSTQLTTELGKEFGFSSFHAEKFQNEVQFTAEELSAYLTTQSNVIAAVEQGTETIEDVYSSLFLQVKPYFQSTKATFMFGGSIWYLQKGAV
ncbi:MAG TPA: methyltransferase domain-containing protein, partial [Anaerolineales bacterium]|nr:methyltransferase domain-containing protein [Anaerolineales bacterium]